MKLRCLMWALLATVLIGVPVSLASDETSPVMVIGFPDAEEERKPYADDLAQIVQKALDADPQAFFQIEVVVPIKGPRRHDKRTKRHASAFAKEVMENIQAAGVDESRIGRSFKHDPVQEIILVLVFVE